LDNSAQNKFGSFIQSLGCFIQSLGLFSGLGYQDSMNFQNLNIFQAFR